MIRQDMSWTGQGFYGATREGVLPEDIHGRLEFSRMNVGDCLFLCMLAEDRLMDILFFSLPILSLFLFPCTISLGI